MILLTLFALNVQHALADVRWLSRTEYMANADDWESFDFYTENRGLRQTLWDFIIYNGLYLFCKNFAGSWISDRNQNYSDVPPDGFDELWNIEERWESQKWFKHHLRVLEDIDQESKSALNEDDLVRILEFNEKLDNEESFRLTVHPKMYSTPRHCSTLVLFTVVL